MDMVPERYNSSLAHNQEAFLGLVVFAAINFEVLGYYHDLNFMGDSLAFFRLELLLSFNASVISVTRHVVINISSPYMQRRL